MIVDAKVYVLCWWNNPKVYVGITKDTVQERYRGHTCGARNGSKTALARAIRKHGDPTAFVTLATGLTWEEACEWEQFWIKELDCKSPHGYNLTAGGDGIADPAPETLVKMKKGNETYCRLLKEDPAFRAKHMEASAKGNETQRRLMKEDPAFRAKHMEALAKGHETYCRLLKEDPAFRAKQMEALAKGKETIRRNRRWRQLLVLLMLVDGLISQP
jgi:hypothetical protein